MIGKTVQKNWHKKKGRGIALLYAILVTATLSIALSSASFLVIQSLTVSFSDRSSQTAFYAALSGTECALYWDNVQLAFGRTASDHVAEVDCFGGAAVSLGDGVVENDADYGDMVEFVFSVEFPDGPQCTDVTVKKGVSNLVTVIESRGYNNCDVSISQRVERGFRAVYGDV